MARSVVVGDVTLGGRAGSLVLIAGPCVIESRMHCVGLAGKLARLARDLDAPLIFKASYDKANRSSLNSYRGPGMERGLEILREVKERHGLPLLTDVHEIGQVGPVADVVDMIQIPAFLCRQTDLVVAAGETGCAVNIKKGQFLAPWDVGNIIAKLESTGNRRIVVTERGTTFGYNTLVADMRSLVHLRRYRCPVVFDATHSVQFPGGQGDSTGGDRESAPYLARAATAVGCDAVFCETHENPERALSDGANALPFRDLRKLWRLLRQIDTVSRSA